MHASDNLTVITWQEINFKIRDKNNTTVPVLQYIVISAVTATFAGCKALVLQPQPLKASKLALLRMLRSPLELELGGYFSGFADSKLVWFTRSINYH